MSEKKITQSYINDSIIPAINSSDVDALQTLLAEVNISPEDAANILELAVCSGNNDLIRAVVALLDEVEPFCRALPYALRMANLEAIELLVDKYKWTFMSASEVFYNPEYRSVKRKIGGKAFTKKQYGDAQIEASKASNKRKFRVETKNAQYYDDDFAYIFENKGDLYPGGTNRFAAFHEKVGLAPLEKRIGLLKTLFDLGILKIDDLRYICFLSVLSDQIAFAEAVESFAPEAAHYNVEAMMKKSKRNLKSKKISDLATPTMSLDKAKFIHRHLEQGESLGFGTGYTQPNACVDTAIFVLSHSDSSEIKNKKQAVLHFINIDNAEALSILGSLGALSGNSLDDYIKQANDQRKMSALAFLLDFKNQTRPQSQVTISQRIQKETADALDPVKAVKKEWRLKEGKKGYSIIAYIGNETDLVIPSVCGSKRIISIAEGALSPQHKKTTAEILNKIVSITISDGIEAIGDEAFLGLESIERILLPSSLKKIGRGVFEECPNLTELEIPPKVTEIGDTEMSSWDLSVRLDKLVWLPSNKVKNDIFLTPTFSTKEFVIGGKRKQIFEKEFVGFKNIESILITAPVKTIEDLAFYGCYCKNVVLPEGLSTIGQGVFANCSLNSVVIPKSVTSVGDSAFSGCSKLTSVTLSEGLTSINNEMFRGCSSLTSVVVPPSVTSIEEGAFHGCSNLSSVTISVGVANIGNRAFWQCKNLASVTIPEGVTSIGVQAFCECSNLTSVTIPDTVTSIGTAAFYGCSGLADLDGFVIVRGTLFDYFGNGTEITIPKDVSVIGYRAFKDCTGLTSVIIPERVTEIGDMAFSGCENLTIHAPVGSVAEKYAKGSDIKFAAI